EIVTGTDSMLAENVRRASSFVPIPNVTIDGIGGAGSSVMPLPLPSPSPPPPPPHADRLATSARAAAASGVRRDGSVLTDMIPPCLRGDGRRPAPVPPDASRATRPKER